MRTHSYPAYFYGPNGESRIFQREEDVPAHWHDHPAKAAKKAGSKPASPSEPLDAHGHPWDAKLHAASKGKTSAGLWRMKVGASRPPPAPGYPLDL